MSNEPHPCPFTDAELMALWAITHCGKNPILAAFLLDHARLHPTTPTTTNEETP